MKGLSARHLLFPAFIFGQVVFLSSCEGGSQMFDNRASEVHYSDAYAPNAPLMLYQGSAQEKVLKTTQKVSEKEITQTATPQVTSTHREVNSSQVPLNAPTVE